MKKQLRKQRLRAQGEEMGYHPLPPPPPEAPRVDNSDAILLVVESLEKIASDICGSNRMELEQEIENLRGLARRAAQ